MLTVWAINRVIDPEGATQLERWVPTTDLPYLAGIPAEEFTKDAFLSALDFVCMDDHASGHVADLSAGLDDALYQKWRHDHPLPPGDKETLAYDITTVLFFGVRALSKNQVIYHRGERRVRRVLRQFQSLLRFLVPLRSPCALR